MIQKTYKILDFLTYLVYPQRCPGCEKVINKTEAKVGFCKQCSSKIEFTGTSTCMQCGRRVPDNTKEFCLDCEKKHRIVKQGKAVYQYSGPMKAAMYRFKYSNKRCYGDVFSKHAVACYKDKIESWEIDGIVPVPMYKKKQRKRGYNQAEVFAKALSRETGIPVYSKLVVREKDTAPMKMLDNTQRRQNVQNTFKLSENKVKLRKILVVDDIYTTGSTIEAVAEQLLTGTAEEIYSLCICIGEAD